MSERKVELLTLQLLAKPERWNSVIKRIEATDNYNQENNMSEVQMSGNTIATITQINEMTNRVEDRIATSRSIARRAAALRERLIGGTVQSAETETAPEPVRPEVDALSHNLNVLGDILVEIETDLSALEGL